MTLPESIANWADDKVSFTTYNPIKQDYINSPCYNAAMFNLGSLGYDLYPNGRKSILPGEVYLTWMELCRRNGLIPADAVFDAANGQNRLHIPMANRNRHLIYAALCCYRWSENKAQIPYQVVKFLEMRPGLDFFQVLHYVLGQYDMFKGGDHSFVPIQKIQTNSCYVQYGLCGWHFVPWSIACKVFFMPAPNRLSLADTLQSPMCYGRSYTIGSIAALLTQWEMSEPTVKTPTAPSYCVALPDLLRDELTACYQPLSSVMAKKMLAEKISGKSS